MLSEGWKTFRQLAGPSPEIPISEIRDIAKRLSLTVRQTKSVVEDLLKIGGMELLDAGDLSSIASRRRLTGEFVGLQHLGRCLFYRVLSPSEARRALLAKRILIEDEIKRTKQCKRNRSLLMRFGPQAGQRVSLGDAERRAVKIEQLQDNLALIDQTLSLLPNDSDTESHLSAERRPIPERVRHEVWRRDEGKCVQCESRERLEFDHIVPIAAGGSNTVRNIQLLCELCNRRKSDKI